MTRVRVAIISFVVLVGSVVAINKLGPLLIDGDWFTAVVGWANVLAAVLAVVVPVALLSPSFDSPDAAAARLEAERNHLVKKIRREEGKTLSRLVAIDKRSETRAIDLRFTRSVLQYRSAGGAPSGAMTTVLNYFQGLSPQRLIVLGESGSGKTVLALDLMIRILGDAAISTAGPIPVRFALASFDDENTLEQWLIAALTSAYQLRPRAAKPLVDEGAILPVLDGLDEMDSDPVALTRANSIVTLINEYLYAGEASPIIVTCRTDTYARLDQGIREATEIVLDVIDAPACVAYLNAQYENLPEELSWVNVVDGLNGAFGLAAKVNILDTLSTPWRISAAISACRSGQTTPETIFFLSSPGAGLPVALRSVDEARVRVLKAFVSVRSRVQSGRDAAPYNEQRLMQWYRYLARYVRDQVAAGRPSDIRLENWWMTRRRAALFAHFFFVLAISAVCFWLIYEALNGDDLLTWDQLEQYQVRWRDLDAAFLWGLLSSVGLAAVALIIGLVLALQPRTVPNRASVRAIRQVSGVATIALGTMSGALAGSLIGGGVGLSGGLSVDLRRSFLIGLIGGVAAGLILGLIRAIGQSRSDRDGPAFAVVDDVIYGLTLGVALGALVAIGGTLSIGLRFGIMVGAAIFLWCLFVMCSRAAVRYFLTVALLLFPPTRMPVRLGRMLDWSAEAGILRRSGATYQFRQDELQKAFANGKI